MLRLDLARLGREDSALVEAQVPADDALWEGSDIQWAGPVDVRLRASHAGTGEIVVRGRLEGTLAQECRRCLEPVQTEFGEDVTMVFVSWDTPGAQDEADLRVFQARGRELDLGDAVREELILAIDPYVVCDPDCRGLCPACGTNRNIETCSCVEEEIDPRWEALRALKESE